MFDAFILGMIQGIFEFLPVSSSAHLLLFSKFFIFSEEAINTNMFDAILHGGSILAILIFFYKDILKSLKDSALLKGIFISTIPTFIFGFFIEPVKDIYFRSVWITVFSLIFWGVYMIIAEKKGRGIKRIEELKLREYIILGLMQSIALIPGTSRSGITISTALLLGIKKENAVTVSFLMGLPVITAAFAYELRKAIVTEAMIEPSTITVGLISSLIFSLLAIVFLVKFIKRFKFSNFAYYRFALAVLIIMYSLWKGL